MMRFQSPARLVFTLYGSDDNLMLIGTVNVFTFRYVGSVDRLGCNTFLE